MIESRIDTVTYGNGEIQRFQVVSGFSWNDLEFVQAPFSKEVFEEFSRMYRAFIIVKHPEMYGALVMFHVPEDVPCPFPNETEHGTFFEKQLICSLALGKLVKEGRIRRDGDGLAVDDPTAAAFMERLQSSGWLEVNCGDKPDEVVFLPLGSDPGYLSSLDPRPTMCCNSHFFEMDVFDMDSPYDLFGTPYGMAVKNGVMSQPPLNGREALMVDLDGNVSIGRPDVKEIGMSIQGRVFRHGVNCMLYTRPEDRVTPKAGGLDLMIVGDEVIAFHEGGGVRIPCGGFVLHTEEPLEICPTPVLYLGFDDCLFGIQVGSSSVKEGKVMDGFESSFYDIRKDPVPYPPTLYPLDYGRDRAPRMAICSDADGDPVIVWAEGPSKLFYRKGLESCGASLLELGRYCRSIGLVNALNMDGGGSSEMFLDGKLQMHVSDRHPDNSDAERPVPMGLMVR